MSALESGMRFESTSRLGSFSASNDSWCIENDDPSAQLQRDFADWMKEITVNEQLFKLHVYENPNVGQTDLRQHRLRLCKTIAVGEALATLFIALGRAGTAQKEEEPIIALIDQQVGKLFSVLLAWHSPLAAQPDVPDSFKQAAKEEQEGKIVDLDI